MITKWFDDDPLFNRYYPENAQYRYYFEHEWGIRTHNDSQLFEMLSLSGFAAGLNWASVLNKRSAFHTAFAHWQIQQIAQMDALTVNQLCANPAIIRNRRKIVATIQNAQLVQRLQLSYGSFDQYLWQQVQQQQVVLHVQHFHDLPKTTAMGTQLANQLQRAGFQFAGPVTVHAWMVTVGLITARPDHAGIELD